MNDNSWWYIKRTHASGIILPLSKPYRTQGEASTDWTKMAEEYPEVTVEFVQKIEETASEAL